MAGDVKLSKAQRDLLRLCAADPRGMTGAVSFYTPAVAVVNKGMAQWRDNDPSSERLIITEAGRAALRSQP